MISWRADLGLNIKTKIIASGPITAWQIEGEKVEAVIDFLFLGSEITMDSDCSHGIRWLLLGRKQMANLDSVLKSRNVTLPTKVHIVQAMVFPVVTYSCESWTIKKAECQRIDAFELWCWRRLLRVPWATGRSKQSILREINPEYSLEGLMPRLRLQHFRHLMWTTDSLSKSLMLGRLRQKEQRARGWDGRVASPMQRTWTWATLRRWWGTGRPGVLQSTGLQEIGHDWVTEQQHRAFLDGKINLSIYLWWWRKWMLLSWVWISVTP